MTKVNMAEMLGNEFTSEPRTSTDAGKKKFMEFCDSVFKDLEYINYPDLVMGVDEVSVAIPMSLTMFASYIGGMSPMLTACLIYGCTWSYAIVPESKDMVKH